MHISKTLRAAIVFGALAAGGAVAGIAGAAAAPTSSTPTTAAPPASTTPSTPTTPATPAPSQKSNTPMKGACPNMGSGGPGASGGSYSGPPPGASSAAGYEAPGPPV